MTRTYVPWAMVIICLVGWMSSGCIVGVHHHRLPSTFEYEGESGTASGSINSVDVGVVADFRYFRLAFPFEGHRRKLELRGEDGTVVSQDEVVEMRTLRLDVPLLSLKSFSKTAEPRWYPGAMARRESLELWLSGSVGMMPDHPVTATASVVYYRYGALAVRLFGGASFVPYEGRTRSISATGDQRHKAISGYLPAAIAGLEVTLAAGEYALELLQFFLDIDRRGREAIRD